MSLMQFLSSGSRSLSKQTRPMGRYRLPEGRVLPDFSRQKNPFNKDISPPDGASSPEVSVTARAASTQAAPPSPALSSPRAAGRMGWILSLLGRVARELMMRVRRAGAGLVSWLKTVAEDVSTAAQSVKLRAMRRRSPFARSASAKLQGPVQGELSLDQVRVVRNDLSETDYEVVRAETASASPVKQVPETVEVSAPNRRPLGRLADRLFKQKAD